MRRTLAVAGTVVLGGWALVLSHPVWGFPEHARRTKAACAACHTSAAGGPELTEAGATYKSNPKAAVPTTARGNEYVGSNKCMICHMTQHKAWRATDHAAAWKTLEAADEKKVAAMAAALAVKAAHPAVSADACVACHVTGFRLAGGYPAADSAKNAALVGVTCESCHGPGSRHVTAPLAEKKKTIALGSEKMCRDCHTPKASPKFDFEEYRKKGIHAASE